MPWTPKQERYMRANYPRVAKRVMSEAGYTTREAKTSRTVKRPPKKPKGGGR